MQTGFQHLTSDDRLILNVYSGNSLAARPKTKGVLNRKAMKRLTNAANSRVNSNSKDRAVVWHGEGQPEQERVVNNAFVSNDTLLASAKNIVPQTAKDSTAEAFKPAAFSVTVQPRTQFISYVNMREGDFVSNERKNRDLEEDLGNPRHEKPNRRNSNKWYKGGAPKTHLNTPAETASAAQPTAGGLHGSASNLHKRSHTNQIKWVRSNPSLKLNLPPVNQAPQNKQQIDAEIMNFLN